MYFSFLPRTLLVPHILFDLLPLSIFDEKNYEAPHYAIFVIILALLLSWFHSTLFSNTIIAIPCHMKDQVRL
jgi:hypothetical protein